MKQYKTVPDFFRENTEKDQQTEADILARKAREALAGLTGQYLKQMDSDIVFMKKLLQKAKKTTDKKRLTLIREDFFLKVHDMKGQGSTFGYPLLTELGAYACEFLRNKTEITDSDLVVLDNVVKDIQLVLDDDLTGTGGQAGVDIRERLVREEKK